MALVRALMAATLVLLGSQAQAALVRPMNIEELVDAADSIFLGTVTAVAPEDPGPGKGKVLAITFSVLETYKGVAGSKRVFRQLARKGPHGRWTAFADLPRFQVGETAVVFLHGESSIGLTSPVAFGQGVFRAMLKPGSTDRSLLANENGNRTLLTRLQGKGTQTLARKLTARGTPDRAVPLTVANLRELIRVHRGVSP